MDKTNTHRGKNFFNKYRGRGRGFRRKSKHNLKNDENRVVAGPIRNIQPKPCEYNGWKLYFPENDPDDCPAILRKIKAFDAFIKSNGQLFPGTFIEEARMFIVDCKILSSDEEFQKLWAEDFSEDLKNHPELVLSCLGLAMHQAITRIHHDAEDVINLPVIRARVVNFEPLVQLKQLKSDFYGKLVTVKGTIIRVGSIKLLCTWMAFDCNTCHNLLCVKQTDGVYTVPLKCSNDGCRSKNFSPLLGSPYTLTINWQCVRLQEIVADEQREGGRVPRIIDCELNSDLVDSCSPGDVVTITGIVKVHDEDESKKKSGNIFMLYLDVVTVMNNKSQLSAGRSAVEFNMKDFYAIKEIHAEPDLFRLLVHSLCPSIYGHEIVKMGLLLCMFGGSQRKVDSRADPHILVVGDPGLGKSRMLQACCNVAPRGVYVCGNTSTSSGLTVTLKREGGGDYALEAGALVLSDQGCCCIDEFDKMNNQHQALLEAMEQQTISIAKAGVVCCLPARTSILAAANPVGGHYNKAKTVSENLRLGPALLSRFDLVFILLDKPDERMDSMLSEHVMALHSGTREHTSSLSNYSEQKFQNGHSLKERLKLIANENLDIIPHQLMRKYIAYARKYVKPRLSRDAAKIVQDFYLELRQYQQGADNTPITTRQLESLVRLTEARAKLELRETATEDDAKDAVEIFKTSMMDTLANDDGALDVTRAFNGSGMSSRNQAKTFLKALELKAKKTSRNTFSWDELKEMGTLMRLTDFPSLIASLNVQGILLKKGQFQYQLVSA